MEGKSQKEFGKRKPDVPSVAPRPAPPAKRSGHVALLLMGTLAVGGGAYALMPSENCERSPNAPSVLQSNAECPPRGSSSSSSSHGGSSGSSRGSFYSGDSSSSHSASGTSSDSGSGGVARGGFGSSAHAFTSHFSGGG